IVGRGSLGRATGALAHAVGMQVLYAERPDAEFVREGYTAFSDVLAQADVLSLHCPLTEQTTKLMNDKTLSAMKAGALLINTGRGALVDEAALLRALDSGHLGGAALDVLSEEPPKADHPLLVAAAQRNNLLITPHVAWASDSAIREVLAQVVHNIEAYVARRPQNVVTL
ncbi:MAG: NAD(P)-dependent oxidoreductase, partial [Plesiomonas shigelloides]